MDATNDDDLLSWDELAKRLTRSLRSLPERSWLILAVRGNHEGAPNYFVQFYNGGDQGLRAEAVSNHFLANEDALDPIAQQRLIELGWIAPEPSPSAPTDNVNYYREWPRHADPGEVVELGLATLREAYRVASPEHLQYSAGDEHGRLLLFPELGLDPQPTRHEHAGSAGPPTLEELRPFVEGALRAMLELEEVERNEHGDFAIRFGSAMFFVRLIEGHPPAIRVFAPLVWNISPSPQLLAALNDINLEIFFGRVVWTGAEVIAVMDVVAHDLSQDDIRFACWQIGSMADHLDDVLQRQFGGTVMFGKDLPPKNASDDAGYL